MLLYELCRAADIACPDNLKNITITAVTSDSRRVVPGALFVCLKGTKTDGSKYIEQARAAGAAAILTEGDGGDLVTADTHRALSFLCREMYGGGIENMRFVGITGTNGKTTIVSMLASILRKAGRKCATVGTLGIFTPNRKIPFNSHDERANMTTPDPELLFPALSRAAAHGAEFAIMEISSHSLAKKKVDALEFEIGVFTNLTRDHLDFHGTIDEYFAAKRRLFNMCEKAIVNIDDMYGAKITPAATCSKSSGNADFRAESIVNFGENGCGFVMYGGGVRIPLSSPIPGNFTVMNVLEAAACALTLGISPEAISEGISSLESVGGRMEKVALPPNAGFSVFIDYAHTPDALENLLKTVRSFADGQRIVLLFGCGGDRDRGKRREMAQIASRLSDFVIVTSDNSRSENPNQIFSDIMRGIDKEKQYIIIKERRDAIEYAVENARRGDVILLAGKGHEKYEIKADGVHPFDEEAAVAAAYIKRYGDESGAWQRKT